MKDITIDVGVDTAIGIDLQNTNASPETPIIFTIKNAPFARTEPVAEREFVTRAVHTIFITAEESMALLDNAEYDFTRKMVDDTGTVRRLKVTENGKIKLRKGVGGGIV